MALFGDKNKKTIEELENYYANGSNRTGMAWLMAFLSLLITVVVLGGLFFGGRWAYRTLTDDDTDDLASSQDEKTGVTVGTIGDTIRPTEDGGVVSDEAASTTDNDDGLTIEIAAGDDADDAADADDASDNGDEADSDETADADDTTVTLGVETDGSGILPNTGAGTALFAIPAVAGVTGYAVARRRASKN